MAKKKQTSKNQSPQNEKPSKEIFTAPILKGLVSGGKKTGEKPKS